MGYTSIKNIVEKMQSFESEGDLFSLKHQGKEYYDLIRYELFHKIAMRSNLFAEAHPKPKKFFWYFDLVFKDLFALSQSLRALKNKTNWVFPLYRKTNAIDIHSHNYIEGCDSTAIIDSSFSNQKYFGAASFDFIFLICTFLAKLFSSATYFLFSLTDKEKDLCKSSKISATEYSQLVVFKLIQHKMLVIFYRLLLLKNKPERVYVVGAYYRKYILDAAFQLDIETIELQHGLYSKYHLGYSYPEEFNIQYQPKKLYIYGEHWRLPNILAKSIETKVIGKDHLRNYSNKNTLKSGILICSQAVIREELLEISIRLAKENPGESFRLKPHPSDKTEYPKVVPPNLEILEPDADSYNLMEKSEIQIGSYSTTLLEGLYYGTPFIVLDLAGSEYFDEILEKAGKKKVSPIGDLNSFLEQKIDMDHRHFFAEFHY
ncbi:MAG: hypothetical protein AB8E15_12490 [Bdellovibrionales bacterium]